MDNTPITHRKKTNIKKKNVYLLSFFPLKINKNLKCKKYSPPKEIANCVSHIFFPMEKRSRSCNLLPKEKESSTIRYFPPQRENNQKVVWYYMVIFCINIWEENKNSIGEGKFGGDLIFPFHKEKENQVAT